MARLIKCPRCQSQVDVTNVSGGATVRCPDCGANLRVPTGQTGVNPKVNAPTAEAPAASSGRKKQTGVFRKMSAKRGPGGTGGGGRRGRMQAHQKSNTGLFVGLGVGALAIAIVLAAVMMSGGKPVQPPAPVAANGGANPAAGQPAGATPPPAPAQPEAPAPKKKDPPKKKTFKKGAIPATFEPGAREFAERQTEKLYAIQLDDALKTEFDALASGGKVAEIVESDAKWIPYIINSMLSDDKDIAWSAYQALHQICKKRNISSSEDGFRNPVKLENFNSSYVRGGEYVFWSEQWWAKPNNQDAVRSWAGGAEVVGRMVDPERADWNDIMKSLRAGGAYEEIDRPEGLAYATVKGMGPKAYPKLINYIDNEDPLLGRAAVAVLNELTGRQSPLPNATTNVTIKSQWESWYKREYPD